MVVHKKIIRFCLIGALGIGCSMYKIAAAEQEEKSWYQKPINLCVGASAVLINAHLWNMSNEKITPLARYSSMLLCSLIGLSGVMGLDKSIRSVDFFNALKCVFEIVPKLDI